MAKTLTISDINISSIVVSIVLNRETGKQVGYSSIISYSIVDPDGVHLMQKNTTKYTSVTDYTDSKMSADAETKLNTYCDAMKELMIEREEL